MAKTLWDINFSTLNVTNDNQFKAFGGKYTHSENLTNGVYTADGQGSTPSFSVNAVDIDWNGALIDNNTIINNTGDLIGLIKEIKESIGNTSFSEGHAINITNNTISVDELELNVVKQVTVTPLVSSGEGKIAIATIKVDGDTKTIYSVAGGSNTTVVENPYDDKWIQDSIDSLHADLDSIHRWTAQEIKDLAKTQKTTYDDLKDKIKGGFESGYYDEELKTWLQRAYDIDFGDEGEKIITWSDLKLKANEITGSVNRMYQDLNGNYQSLNSTVTAQTRDIEGLQTAYASIGSTYIKADGNANPIAWLKSSYEALTDPTKTISRLISDAKDEAENTATTTILSEINTVNGKIVSAKEELGGRITTVENKLSSGVITERTLDGAFASLFALVENNETKEAVKGYVDVSVRNGISSAKISADKITLDGTTWADTIFAGEAFANTIRSKVNGTEYLYVTDDLGGTAGKRSTAITPTSITFWDNTFTSRIDEYIAQANSRQNLINNRIAGLNEYSLSLPYKYPGVTGNVVGLDMFSGDSSFGGYLKICKNSAGAVYATDYMLMAKARSTVGDQAFDIGDNFGDVSTGSKVKKLFTLSPDGLQWSNHSLSDGLQGFISIAFFDPGAESSSNIQLYDSVSKKQTVIHPGRIDVDGPISATSFVTIPLSSAQQARIISQDDEEEGNEETSKLFMIADEDKETAFYCTGDSIGFVNKNNLDSLGGVITETNITNYSEINSNKFDGNRIDIENIVVNASKTDSSGTKVAITETKIVDGEELEYTYYASAHIDSDGINSKRIKAAQIDSDEINSESIKVGDGNELKHTTVANQPTLTITSVGNIELKADINTPNSSTELALTAEGGIYCNDKITATQFITDSDINKKNIISDTTLTVDQIANAPAVNFTYKDSNDTDEQVGTIAQYWQVVLPQVVGSRQDGTLTMNYGNAAMVSSIVTAKEVVELKSKVQDLEAENARLKLRLAKIEEKLGL